MVGRGRNFREEKTAPAQLELDPTLQYLRERSRVRSLRLPSFLPSFLPRSKTRSGTTFTMSFILSPAQRNLAVAAAGAGGRRPTTAPRPTPTCQSENAGRTWTWTGADGRTRTGLRCVGTSVLRIEKSKGNPGGGSRRNRLMAGCWLLQHTNVRSSFVRSFLPFFVFMV